MRLVPTIASLAGGLALAALSACNTPPPYSPQETSGSTGGLGFGNGSSGTQATAGSGQGATGGSGQGATGGAGSTTGTPGSGSAGTTGGPPPPDPTKNGPFIPQTADVSVTNPATNNTVPIHAFYPTSSLHPPAPGSCPVVVFVHGLFVDGITSVDASAYYDYGNRLASFGYVVVFPNYVVSSSAPNYPQYASDVMTGLAWALGYGTQANATLSGLVNAKQVGITGHGVGASIALLAAENNPGTFSAAALLDIVDAAGTQSGLAGLGSFPTAFLGETGDETSNGQAFAPACAPAGQNFVTLFNAASTPSLEVTVTGAGAASFVPTDAPSGSCLLECSECGNGANTTTVQDSQALLVAFYERRLRGNTAYDQWLGGALSRTLPGPATLQSK